MKEKWTKLKLDRGSCKVFLQGFLISAAIIATVLPIVLASSMSFYRGDDFAQLPVKEFDGNFFELILVALRYAKNMFMNWQGAYFSMFINVLLSPILGGGVNSTTHCHGSQCVDACHWDKCFCLCTLQR